MLENPWETAAKKFPEGGVVEGTVTKLMEFGAFVEVEPGIEGLVHVSELGDHRQISEGDAMRVKVVGVDHQGKVKLSRQPGVE